MRILFVTPAFPPMPGGGERYAAALAGHLRSRGHTVNVITSGAAQESELWAGAAGREQDDHLTQRLSLRPFPGGRSGLMVYRKAMVLLSALPGDQSSLLSRLAGGVPWIEGLAAALVAAPPVDLIHGFNLSWEGALVASARVARERHVPLVITPFAHFGAGAHDRVARNSTMDHQLRLMREAAGVLVLTAIERQELASYGVRPEKISVVGGSADPLPPDWPAALESLETMPLPRCYVLFLGRASRDKGAIDAAEAVLALRRKGQDAALVLAGTSSPEFSRWLERLSAVDQPGIVPLGPVSEQTKHALLSRASMLVLPSRSDSFGIVVLEAWQHGKPVIGARAGGIPGVIDEGRNGLLVDYGDSAQLSMAMAHLLNDPGLSQALGADGLRKVTTDLTWERTAARTESAYRQILDAT